MLKWSDGERKLSEKSIFQIMQEVIYPIIKSAGLNLVRIITPDPDPFF